MIVSKSDCFQNSTCDKYPSVQAPLPVHENRIRIKPQILPCDRLGIRIIFVHERIAVCIDFTGSSHGQTGAPEPEIGGSHARNRCTNDRLPVLNRPVIRRKPFYYRRRRIHRAAVCRVGRIDDAGDRTGDEADMVYPDAVAAVIDRRMREPDREQQVRFPGERSLSLVGCTPFLTM